MTYLLAALAGIVAAVVGWFVTGAVTVWIAGLYGMSDFEGGRGMFAFLGVGPIGGLICMAAAAWAVLRAGKGRAPFGRAVGRLAVVVGGIAMAVAAAIWIRLATLDTYTDSAPPTLEFEIRVPSTLTVPDPSELRVELDTNKNVGEGLLAQHWSPGEQDRKVLAGQLSLDFKTRSRLLVVKIPDQATRLFSLPLARDPGSTDTFAAWQRPNFIHANGEEVRKAPSDDPFELRYRVRRAGED